MKTFLYTLPKAGTYLIATFLEYLGLQNTGWHVSKTEYLDTRQFGLAENAQRPSTTAVQQSFLLTTAQLQDGQFAFGHMCLPLLSWGLPDYKFICAYRHPRSTLLSEFLDFRFRRTDVDFVSRDRIPDDQEAFLTYLRQHGPIHMEIFAKMVDTATVFAEPTLRAFPSGAALFVNFDAFRSSAAAGREIARHLGIDPELAPSAHARALASETKTKALGLARAAPSLWTPEADQLARKLRLGMAVKRARLAGLIL